MREWLRERQAAIWRLLGGVSLRLKIMGIALMMIVLLGLGLTWQVRQAMTRTLSHELEQLGISVADNFADQSVDLILTTNAYELYKLTRDVVVANEDVRYAFILDPQGHLLSHSFDDGFPTDLLEANVAQTHQRYQLEMLQTEEGLIQDVAVPVFGGRAGTARVGMSQRRLDQTLASITRQLLLTTLLVSLLGVGISTALTWLLTQPILGLAEATRRVAQRDLDHKLTPWANDEIGQLQASFNTMMEHLARSRQELEAYNLSLLRRNRELSTLYAISRAVAGPLRLTEVLERGLDQTMNLVHAAGGWICKLGEDSSCRVSVDTWQGPSQPDVGLDNCRQCPTCLEVRKTRQLLVVGSFPPNCPLRAAGDGNGIPPACHVAVPLLVREQVVGLLSLVCEEQDCFEAEDLDLLEAVGRQLGIAVENARLWEEVRRKEAMRGELLRKIITAQEEERQRIAWELHDETGQTLTSLLVNLRVMERANSVKEVRTLIPDMREVLVQTLDEVHHLALELRPSVLDDLGLVPALTRYAQDCPARFGLEVDFVTAGLSNQRLPLQIETTLYRVAQEALTNVARHSGARHVSVLLERRRGSVVLVVEDDGRGFDVTQVMTSAQKRKHFGLYGMEERASLVGGRLTIESEPDVGTTVSVEIPLEVAWLGKEIRTP